VCVCVCVRLCARAKPYPLTEEVRKKIFGSPDDPVFLDPFLSDGDSVYSLKTTLKSGGLPGKCV